MSGVVLKEKKKKWSTNDAEVEMNQRKAGIVET